VAEKKKTDIRFPFFRVKEDAEETYVKVGPIEVVDRKSGEDVKVGPLHIVEGDIKIERSLNSKLEGIAWGVFIILIGCVWLSESTLDLDLSGVVAIGIGVIWLALNYARSQLGIKTSTFTIVLGLVAIIYGFAQRFIGEIELIAVIAIAVGIYFIIAFGRRSF
jgi:hypothetical protein